MADTLEIVQEVLSDKLGIDEAEVTREATIEGLGIDSLDMVELTCDLEEQLEIEFGEPEGLATIGDLVDYVDSLKE